MLKLIDKNFVAPPNPARQCDAYVECAGGQVVQHQLCGDGLAFDKYGDPKHVRCKYIQQVDCAGRQGKIKKIIQKLF